MDRVAEILQSLFHHRSGFGEETVTFLLPINKMRKIDPQLSQSRIACLTIHRGLKVIGRIRARQKIRDESRASFLESFYSSLYLSIKFRVMAVGETRKLFAMFKSQLFYRRNDVRALHDVRCGNRLTQMPTSHLQPFHTFRILRIGDPFAWQDLIPDPKEGGGR